MERWKGRKSPQILEHGTGEGWVQGYSLFGVISDVPGFRIWSDFPPFRPSTVPAFSVSDLEILK